LCTSPERRADRIAVMGLQLGYLVGGLISTRAVFPAGHRFS
jgi:hypothetical protein